jgi:hypothetical protein
MAFVQLVRKTEFDDGKYTVKVADKGGKKTEFHLGPTSGNTSHSQSFYGLRQDPSLS